MVFMLGNRDLRNIPKDMDSLFFIELSKQFKMEKSLFLINCAGTTENPYWKSWNLTFASYHTDD